jgi:hypothetical protein
MIATAINTRNIKSSIVVPPRNARGAVGIPQSKRLATQDQA